MTFPSLGGNLTDPWVDGALVNAAAMKTNTTDKLNALADSLLVKTARVACDITLGSYITTAAVYNAWNATAIVNSVGGTFSIASQTVDGLSIASVVVPTAGVYAFTAKCRWGSVVPSGGRRLIEAVRKVGATGVTLMRQNSPWQENFAMGTGIIVADTAIADSFKLTFRAYTDDAVGLYDPVASIVKISD